MFAGIIEKFGTLVKRSEKKGKLVLTFKSSSWEKPLKRGESMSVNGVCLTITAFSKNHREFVVEAVPETVAQTTIGELRVRDKVNLERSLTWGERIGGHFVLGHVDGVGKVSRKKMHGKSFLLQIDVPDIVMQHLVPKGSIAVEGISLTIQRLLARSIEIAIIPHTAEVTTLGKLRVGDRVNLEADVIAKHLARWVQSDKKVSMVE